VTLPVILMAESSAPLSCGVRFAPTKNLCWHLVRHYLCSDRTWILRAGVTPTVSDHPEFAQARQL